MDTTLNIQDELLARVKQYAKRTGQPLNAVVEEGLRLVLTTESPRERYVLPDYSVGEADGRDPLETHSWQELRDVIYGKPKHR